MLVKQELKQDLLSRFKPLLDVGKPEDIEGYTLINTIGNETGKYTSSKTIEVTYVYQFTKGQGSVEEPVINPPVEEPPHTSVNTSIYALVLLVNVLGISVLLKKREN